MRKLSSSDSNYMMKKTVYASFALFMGLFVLSGCGSDKSRETRVSIDKDGAVVGTIYEKFDQDYYDISELSDMASQEISYYNSEYITPKISLDEVAQVEDEPYVRLVMSFDSSSDYSHFNQTVLFYGTVEEANAKGYELSADLVNGDGQRIDLGAQDYLGRHIIITNEKIIVDAPYGIEYRSNGVNLRDKKEADLTNVLSDSVQLLLSK